MVECLLFIGARAVAGEKTGAGACQKPTGSATLIVYTSKVSFANLVAVAVIATNESLTFPGIIIGLTLRRIEAQARQVVRSQRR